MQDINYALTLHRSGKLSEAERVYRSILALQSKDINANLLLGRLLDDTNRSQEARHFLELANKYKPNDILITHSLGKCLIKLNSLNEAEKLLALLGEKDLLVARLHLSVVTKLENQVQVDKLLALYLALWPNDASLLIAAAETAEAGGELKKAKLCYEKALAIDPNRHVALHNLGTIERRLGNLREALALLVTSSEQGLDSFELYHNLGNVYSDLNQVDEAMDCFRKAIQRNPYYDDSYLNLANLMAEKGDPSGLFKLYQGAIDADTFTEEMILSYGRFLIRFGAVEDAETLLNGFPTMLSSNAQAKQMLAQIKHLQGNTREAYQQLQVIPGLLSAQLDACKYLLQLGDAQTAIKQITPLLENPETEVLAKAYLYLAQRLLQNNEHQETFYNYDYLVNEFTLPDVFHNMTRDDFCSELARYLDGIHTSKAAPLNQTLNNGTQTRGNLLNSDNPLLIALKSFFIESINRYNRSLKEAPIFDKLIPQTFTAPEFIGAWSVKLVSEGYHSNHVHPEGRLSAVFYVDVPEAIDHETKAGCLAFGQPNFELPEVLTHEYSIMPKVGKLVIFPSYFWHGTLPFSSTDTRLTIAFDVIPEN